MRGFFVASLSLAMLGSAQASSVVTLPAAQQTPSVMALGAPTGTTASMVGTLGEPATDDAMVSSIGEQPIRYEAPLVIRGGIEPTQPASAAAPTQQIQGGPPQTARSAPMSNNQMAERAQERAARAARQQQAQQSAAPSSPVTTAPVSPGIVRPE